MTNNSSSTYIIKNKSIASMIEVYKLIIRGVSVLKKVTEDSGVYKNVEIDTDLFMLAMEKGVTVPKFSKYKDAVSMMNEGVEEAMNSDMDIKASLMTLQKKIDSFLKND